VCAHDSLLRRRSRSGRSIRPLCAAVLLAGTASVAGSVAGTAAAASRSPDPSPGPAAAQPAPDPYVPASPPASAPHSSPSTTVGTVTVRTVVVSQPPAPTATVPAAPAHRSSRPAAHARPAPARRHAPKHAAAKPASTPHVSVAHVPVPAPLVRAAEWRPPFGLFDAPAAEQALSTRRVPEWAALAVAAVVLASGGLVLRAAREEARA
jgi:hypothetical protein